MTSYRIPINTPHRAEIVMNKSRFITTISMANSVDDARTFISEIRNEMPNANHHVYAFRVGYGNTVTEGMSDDGEPTGTSGPPSLAVLRGSDIGDIISVTTRYFGGTKLGTGGLVKAYTQALQHALDSLDIELKTTKILVDFVIPYNLYNIVKSQIANFEAKIQNETFAEDISMTLEVVEHEHQAFIRDLIDKTSGQVQLVENSE